MGNLMECFSTYSEACEWAKIHCDADTFDINEAYEEDGTFCGYGVYDIT